MTILAYTVIILYTLALSYITLYCLMQFHLLFYYQKYHHTNTLHTTSMPPPAMEKIPFVTIQLPIFNELYVVERLIDNIVQIDYPKDRYEIHILDDSTDETLAISERKVAEYQAKGYNIELFHRTDRTGFKAGALRAGMRHAKGVFIAIFDADFLPRTDFLKQTIPHFENPKVGVVQTRWEHINQNYSLITQLQALQLNVHFTVEQSGRKAGNFMLQFNGTAGVWRTQTIHDAGGWEADTLTEDLDLSYRAQLKGWQIVYLENISSPAELPAEMNGLKSQQFRWMKGGAETARKMLPTVWQSQLSIGQKIHASVHLLSSAVFLFVFLGGVFSVPLVFALQEMGINARVFALFWAGLAAIVVIYFVANVQASFNKKEGSFARRVFKFLVLFPLFLALSMGLSLHNSIAVLQGYLGRKSPFVRTPKFNIHTLKDTFRKQKYRTRNISWTTVFEGILALYFLGGILAGWCFHNTSFVLFHAMLMVGYGTIFYYSVRHLHLK